MLGSIPNQKKTVTIEYPIDSVRDIMKLIKYYNSDYKLINSDDVKCVYSYSTNDTPSSRVLIDVSLNPRNKNATDVTIEVHTASEKFDQTHETNSKDKYIEYFILIISTTLSFTKEQLEKLKQSLPTEASLKGKQENMHICKMCKKMYYVDNKIPVFAICPHCKEVNKITPPSILKPLLEGFLSIIGLIIFTIIAAYLLNLVFSIFP
jgi:hypothetical protein